MYNDTLDLQFLLALGTEPYLYDDLKTVYNSDKLRYYQLYRESQYYNHIIFEAFNTKTHEQLIYAVALWESDERDTILRLMKKGYRGEYNYVKNSGEMVSEIEYQEKMMHKFHASGEQMPKEIEMINSNSALLYFAKVFRKPVEMLPNALHQMTNLYLSHRTSDLALDRSKIALAVAEYGEDIQKLKETFIAHKSERIHFENFCELVINREHRYIEGDLETEHGRALVFQEGMYGRYIGFVTTILKLEGVGEDVLGTIELKQDDFNDVAFYALNALAQTDIPKSEVPSMLVFATFLKVFIKEYKETRNNYLKKDKEEDYFNAIKMLEKALQRDKDKVAKADAILHDYNSLKEGVKDTNNYIKQLEKENKAKTRKLLKLEQENDNLEQEIQRVENLNVALQQQLTVMYDLKLRLLQKEDIIIIGGNTNWQKKIAQVLPKAEFIDIDKQMDFSFLANTTATIVVNTATNSHGFMEGIHNVLTGVEKSYKSINGNYGTERTVEELYKCIYE